MTKPNDMTELLEIADSMAASLSWIKDDLEFQIKHAEGLKKDGKLQSQNGKR